MGDVMVTATTRVAPEKADFRPALSSLPYAGSSPEKSVAKMTYTEQLKHPNWQRKRLEVMESAGWECENCGTKEVTLHVHHKIYIKGRMAWEYERDQLMALCEGCHEHNHEQRQILDRMLAESAGAIGIAVGLLAGYLDAECLIDQGLAHMGREGNEPYYELGVVASAAECLGVDGWREIVRRVVQARKCTPSHRLMVEQWDEENPVQQ
jgi:hypothetical protein